MADGAELVLDQDALLAAVDVISRMGAKDFEVGYLDEGATHLARWWATATWNGTKATVGNQAGPDKAAEALANQLLEGGQCTHCGGRVHLGGAPAALRRRHPKLCAWKRDGRRWVRGCIDRVPEGQRSVPDLPTRRGELPRRTR